MHKIKLGGGIVLSALGRLVVDIERKAKLQEWSVVVGSILAPPPPPRTFDDVSGICHEQHTSCGD
jgi:hypothetical protein